MKSVKIQIIQPLLITFDDDGVNACHGCPVVLCDEVLRAPVAVDDDRVELEAGLLLQAGQAHGVHGLATSQGFT